MAYSRCGLPNALYRGTQISSVRHVNDLFMKYNIPLALLAAVSTFAEGVNVSLSVYLLSLQIGLDDDREGLLLIDDGLYLHLTDDPINEINSVSKLIEST